MTNDTFGAALPLTAETSAAVAARLAPLAAAARCRSLAATSGRPQGRHDHARAGRIGLLGGDSGAALDASEIQIWTDVDGMMTADPRREIDARRASIVVRGGFGAGLLRCEVLHPSTILPAVAKNIPVKILNSRKFDGGGTLITGARRSTSRSPRSPASATSRSSTSRPRAC